MAASTDGVEIGFSPDSETAKRINALADVRAPAVSCWPCRRRPGVGAGLAPWAGKQLSGMRLRARRGLAAQPRWLNCAKLAVFAARSRAVDRRRHL